LTVCEIAACRMAVGRAQLCRIFGHPPERSWERRCFAVAKDVEDTTVGLILLWLLGIPLPIIIILLLLWH